MAIGAAMMAGGALAGALGSKGGERKTRSKASLPGFLRRPMEDSVERGERAIQNTGFVPMTSGQRESLGQAERFAENFSPETVSVGSDLARSTLSGEFLDPSTNPGLQGTLDAATGRIMDEFQQNILPEIGSAAQRAGAFGGSRQGIAEGLAAGETSRAVGDTVSQILGENFARERGLQLATLQQAPALQAAEVRGGLLPSEILGQVGSARRSEAQAQESFPAQREMQMQQFLTGFAPNFRRQTQTTQRRQNPWVGAMQGATGGAQLFHAGNEAGIFS